MKSAIFDIISKDKSSFEELKQKYIEKIKDFDFVICDERKVVFGDGLFDYRASCLVRPTLSKLDRAKLQRLVNSVKPIKVRSY